MTTTDTDGTEVESTKYEGGCENCGAIEFDEHPDMVPSCPACEAPLAVVQEVSADSVSADALDAAELREAREMVEMMEGGFGDLRAAEKSRKVLGVADV